MALAASSCAQSRVAAATQSEDNAQKPAQSTKLEAFLAKKGRVIVKQFADLGEIRSLGTMRLTEVTLTEPGVSDRIRGVRVQIKESGSLEREGSVFLDMDEIDGAIKAVDYMSSASKTLDDGAQHEVSYVTRGEFSLTVFNRGSHWSGAASAGRIGRVDCFFDLQQMARMKQMLQDGLTHLNSH